MTEKNKTQEIADPLAEQKAIMGRHLKGSTTLSKTERGAVAEVKKAFGGQVKFQTRKKTNRLTDQSVSQQVSNELMAKVTFKLPESLLTQWKRLELTIKQAHLDQPKGKRKVKTQDLFTEAVEDYVKKMGRKYKVG